MAFSSQLGRSQECLLKDALICLAVPACPPARSPLPPQAGGADGETVALLSADNDSQETSRWSLIELVGYVAALAVEGNAPILRRWQWGL